MKIIMCVFIAATGVSLGCLSVGLIGKLDAYVEMQLASGVPWYKLLITCSIPVFLCFLLLSMLAWLIYDYNK